MATIRAYTTIEQSRKLAQILPIESTDMMYHSVENEYGNGAFVAISKVITNGLNNDDFYIDDIPCWSLAVLLEIIKKLIGYSLQSLDTHTVFMNCELGGKPYNIVTGIYDNPIDACYEMIIHLHELKAL